ncbi:hypothetical protein FOMPIDRAFT_1097535, partial [Fomitopsis schrenkii]
YKINVALTPEQNVHNWLDPQNPHYRKDLAQCVFYYAARIEQTDRFKVCVATMPCRNGVISRCAWKHCHRRQVIIDGTFGICTSRLLLWIAMGVNESNHGVPVALFLFSAPTGNRATHAGYDSAILTELLQEWKLCLGNRDEESFEPYIGITDTDTKERIALTTVWPRITLLLCRFHVRQCWTNRRKSLKLGTLAPFWASFAKQQLYTLEERLLATTEHEDALSIIIGVETLFQSMLLSDPSGQPAATAVNEFIAYLRGTWMPYPLWRSWARRGRIDAAERMGVDIDFILPTTNHLESFNGSLKRKYI